MEEIKTFSDLNSMIDWWNTEINDSEGVFKNQAEDVTKNFFKMKQNKEKVMAVGQRLNVLNNMNRQLDNDLNNASNLVKRFETIMVQLQNIVIMMQDKTPIDVPRERIFGLTENINTCLNSCQKDAELLNNVDLKHVEKSRNPAENVAYMMMMLLTRLESLESKMEEMKCHINWIHHECKRITVRTN